MHCPRRATATSLCDPHRTPTREGNLLAVPATMSSINLAIPRITRIIPIGTMGSDGVVVTTQPTSTKTSEGIRDLAVVM